LYRLGHVKGWDVFQSLESLSGLLVMSGTFWLNAYSIIKLFSFSSTFVERFHGLGEDFVFNSISPTLFSVNSLWLSFMSWKIPSCYLLWFLPEILHPPLPLYKSGSFHSWLSSYIMSLKSLFSTTLSKKARPYTDYHIILCRSYRVLNTIYTYCIYWFVDSSVACFPLLECKLQEEEILLHPQPVCLVHSWIPYPYLEQCLAPSRCSMNISGIEWIRWAGSAD